MMEMENMKQMIQELLGGMEERMNADRKADKEEIQATMQEDRKANQEEQLARMDADGDRFFKF
jgi:hypothetical protein